ncbi:MAG: succinate dehydrogenase, cytochrome b556 subunit, partial [Mycobacterium sp.]
IVGIVFLLLMVPAGVVTGIHIWEHLR